MITKSKSKETISIVYGPHGVGKSTALSKLNDAVFINIEDGLGSIEVDTLGECNSYDDFKNQVEWLLDNEHGKKVLVIDSVTELEILVRKHLIDKWKAKGIEDVDGGFGKGYTYAAEEFLSIMQMMRALRDEKKMHIIFIGHEKVVECNLPGSEKYDKVTVNLNKKILSNFSNMVDNMLYCRFVNDTKQEDRGFGNTQNVAIGDESRREMVAQKIPQADCKNRIGLDKFSEFSAERIQQALDNHIK